MHEDPIDKQDVLSNLYLFNKKALNYRQMEIQPHLELCNFIQRWHGKQRKLILMPRGSFKSSCVSVGYSLWLMVQPENSPYTLPSLVGKGGNKNIRILIDGEERNKVPLEKLTEIKGKIESNNFKLLFGNLRPQISGSDYPWREEKITIAIRDLSIWGVPTVNIGGIDIATTGAHFDLIIADDIHGETNTRSDDQLQKTIDHYKYYGALLDPLGYLIVIGTYWHAKDVYHFVQQNPDILRQYDVFIRRAHNPDGTLLFPEVLSEEFLKQRKAEMGVFYYPQYELEIVAGEDALVRKEDIQHYQLRGDEIYILGGDGWQPKGIKVSDLSVATTCDEAHTKERYSDYTGIVTKGEDKEGNWYILESKRGRWKESETIDEMRITIGTWHPRLVGLESQRFDMLASELEKNRIYPKELKHRGRSKHERFRALEPMFARRKIYLLQDQTNLQYEILCYRRDKFTGEHDDESDALAYQRDLTSYPVKKRKPLSVGGYETMEQWQSRYPVGV